MSQVFDGRPSRQDTFDLRGDLLPDSDPGDELSDTEYNDSYGSANEELHRSVIEDDEIEDDESSQLSIPDEVIDFDLVYSLRKFVATTEGQANVKKGESMFLIDDTNSYWWLVRVLATQEIGYIPAENIETPIERLARLNKHRNVDLASATPAERGQAVPTRRTPNFHRGYTSDRRSVVFTGSSVYYYPPFVWGDPARPLDEQGPEEYLEDDSGDYQAYEGEENQERHVNGAEPDDGISWEEGAIHQPNPQPLAGTVRSELFDAGVNSMPPDRAVFSQQNTSTTLPYSQHTSYSDIRTAINATTPEFVDPTEIAETRKLSATPTIARDLPKVSITSPSPSTTQTHRSLSISSTASGSSESGGIKRHRDEITDMDAEGKRSKPKAADRKLRKERSISGDSRESHDSNGESKDKKKGGFLVGLFGRRKKEYKLAQSGDVESLTRSSMDSGHVDGFEGSSYTPEPESASSYDPMEAEPILSDSQASQATTITSSPHLQSVSNDLSVRIAGIQTTLNNTLAPPRASRPGSLILTATESFGAIVPELSVLRVFAGDHLQSEATFKTVLINASTTTEGLIRQAIQRFRLPEGEDPADYCITIKQLEGDEAVLRKEEHPLQAFEALVERVPQVPITKRTSVGSINSLASNLSLSMAKYGMNDFTDDSTVKLYLHRAIKDPSAEQLVDLTDRIMTTNQTKPNKPLDITTSSALLASVSPERFSSPSARFALQVYIYPDDLPDGMVFDPHTEAIIPKSSLQARSGTSVTISPGVSQTQRRKILVFPRNTTVAEVVEASLERFGINEGVVEGGDEVEDKPIKRRSASRVRYGLNIVTLEGQQRELQPSSKAYEAFPNPPLLKSVDRRSSEWRRRSADSVHIIGMAEDIQTSDPIFVLKRVVGSRGPKKGRLSGPLDEIALRQLHRESASSEVSQVSSSSSQKTQRIAGKHDRVTVTENSDRGSDFSLDDTANQNHLNDGQRLNSSAHNSEEMVRTNVPTEEKTRYLAKAITKEVDPVRVTAVERSRAHAFSATSTEEPLLSVYSDHNRPTSSPPLQERAEQPTTQLSAATLTPSTTVSAAPQRHSPALRSESITPTRAKFAGSHQPHPSIESVMSDLSAYTSESEVMESADSNIGRTWRTSHSLASSIDWGSHEPETVESGVSRVIAITELVAALLKPHLSPEPMELDQVLLGGTLQLHALHPRVKEIFAHHEQSLSEINTKLDHLIRASEPLRVKMHN